jgi:2'-5' RNA ligase
MKKFATYLKVTLVSRPDWFNSFYAKYSEPHELHITLTQPRGIHEVDIEKLKSETVKVLENYDFKDTDRTFTFDTCAYDKESDENHTVMLVTEGSELLNNLQKDLREIMQKFGDYLDPVMGGYEINFKPHLTIGSNISNKEIEEVKTYLGEQESFPQGEITELVLVVVENMNITETKIPENLTVFNL